MLLRCIIFFWRMSESGQKPSTCAAPACLLFPAADILRGTITLDVPAGENQERAQTMSLHPPGFIEGVGASREVWWWPLSRRGLSRNRGVARCGHGGAQESRRRVSLPRRSLRGPVVPSWRGRRFCLDGGCCRAQELEALP